MKKFNFCQPVLLAVISSVQLFAQELTIDYFGQGPPEDSAVIFAPGIISRIDYASGGVTFSPDGTECLFNIVDIVNWKWADILYAKYEGGSWSDFEPADFIQSSEYFDLMPFMSPDGKSLFFSSARPSKEGYYVDVWKIERDESGWLEPVSLGPGINTSNDDTYSTVSLNRTLYYCTDNTGDIFCSTPDEEGKYLQKQRLGAPVNTSKWDGSPYVAPDESYLLISSERPEGYGAEDIYISYPSNDGGWTNPKNLGPKINTSTRQKTPKVTPDGKYLLFEGTDGTYWIAIGSLFDSLKTTNFEPYVKNPLPDQVAYVNEQYTFQLNDSVFHDDDGNETIEVSFSLENDDELPKWLQPDETAKTLTGTPTEVEVLTIKVTAADTADASVSDYFKLNIINPDLILHSKTISLTLYPNPTEGILYLESSGIRPEGLSYEIFDMSGKLTVKGKVVKNSIRLQGMQPGIYFLKVHCPGQIFIQKVLLK
ncbi:MAG: putative Ig domain-containing protein [Bacteroidales bacterium]|jgi:hypothetical protein